MIHTPHILVLAEWFPHPEDPQLGIFIEKHTNAAAQYASVNLIYVRGSEKQDEKFKTEITGTNPRIIRNTFKKSKWRFINLIRFSKAYKLAAKEVQQPDLIHIQVCGRNYLAASILFPKIPFVITEHWSGHLTKNTLIGESKTREAFRKAKKISVVSERLQKVLSENYERNDMLIIPNIIDVSGEREKIKHNTVQLLVVADLVDEIKNISGIFEALKNLQTEQEIEVRIIGEGKDRNNLEKKAREINHPKIRFQFAGRKTNAEVLRAIQESDFMVMNSNTETFSMVCAESIAAGKPVVATRCGGPEEFVHAKNGVLIEKNNPKELQKAIEWMISNFNSYPAEEMKKEMSEKFGKSKVAQQLKEFYRQALENKE